MDKPLLGRNEAAGHSKECEAGLVGILAALSRATEALPLSQREAYIGAPDQAASLSFCYVCGDPIGSSLQSGAVHVSLRLVEPNILQAITWQVSQSFQGTAAT